MNLKLHTTYSSISPITISSVLLALCGACIFLYIYFVASSVLHVVVRQDAEAKSSTLLSDIASLETDLITAQHTISSRLAALEGYEEDQEKTFLVQGGEDGVALGNPQTR